MLFKCCLVLLIAGVWARTTPLDEPKARSEDSSSMFGDLRYVYKVYQECASKDLGPCLKLKLISAMDRVARTYSDIEVIDGISFVKNPNSVALNEIKTEEEYETTLPRALNEKNSALNTMISDKIASFFDSHSLQVKFPTALTEEGRKKGGKGGKGGLFLIPLILGGTLVPLALGALALLAGKALIVSKLALVLAGIIGLKKLLGGGGGGHESGHEVVVNSGHGSNWGRSYEKEQAQKLAYNAYAPQS